MQAQEQAADVCELFLQMCKLADAESTKQGLHRSPTEEDMLNYLNAPEQEYAPCNP